MLRYGLQGLMLCLIDSYGALCFLHRSLIMSFSSEISEQGQPLPTSLLPVCLKEMALQLQQGFEALVLLSFSIVPATAWFLLIALCLSAEHPHGYIYKGIFLL